MIDIVIADDEKLIREGLKTLIDWESLGFRVVAIGRDGTEALNLINKHKPQVSIIDIRMPGLTGLEVIKNTRSTGLNVHFIILSGYKDFGYVKEALTYHADNYLLKPIDEDELIETLNKVKGYIEADSASVNPVSKDRLVKSYFRSYLGLSSEKVPEIDFNEIKQENYQILLLHLPRVGIEDVEKWLSDSKIGILLSHGRISTILLSKCYLRRGGLSDINYEVKKFSKGNVFDGFLSKCVKNLDELPTVLNMARDGLERRFFASDFGIASSISFVPFADIKHSSLDKSVEGPVLQKLVEVGNEVNIRNAIDNYSLEMRRQNYTEQEVKDWYCELSLTVFTSLVNDNNLGKNSVMGNSELIMEIQGTTRLFELNKKLVTIMVNAINKEEIMSVETIVKKMQFLVENHYMENIKLKDLSEILNYNSAYLGKLFKSQCGESFGNFVDKYRIEKAKELLKQGLKVHQVSEKVGYSYVDYFHAKFKKYVGMSPLEFRNNS